MFKVLCFDCLILRKLEKLGADIQNPKLKYFLYWEVTITSWTHFFFCCDISQSGFHRIRGLWNLLPERVRWLVSLGNTAYCISFWSCTVNTSIFMDSDKSHNRETMVMKLLGSVLFCLIFSHWAGGSTLIPWHIRPMLFLLFWGTYGKCYSSACQTSLVYEHLLSSWFSKNNENSSIHLGFGGLEMVRNQWDIELRIAHFTPE